MQEHRFEVRLADINGVNLDAAFVGFGDDRRQHILRLMCHDRDLVIGGDGFEHVRHAFERFRQRFGIVVLADVQDERFGLPDLLREFLLCAKRDQFAVIYDTNTVGKLLSLLHIVCCV